MDIELLACPNCGSELFKYTTPEKEIIFHVSTHYLALVVSEGGAADAGLINDDNICCGACTWTGDTRQLVPSLS